MATGGVRDASSRFLDAFNIDKTLGSGSFGAVFKVTKPGIGDEFDHIIWSKSEDGSPVLAFQKNFAVKIIPEGKLTEVRPAAQLIHPHIVQVYNVWAEGQRSRVKDLREIRELLENQRVPSSSCSSNSVRGQNSEGHSGEGQSGEEGWSPASTFLVPPFMLVQMELCTDGDLDQYLLKRPFLLTPEDPDCFQLYYPETQNFFMQILEALFFMELKGVVHGDLKPNNIFLTRKPSGGALILKIGDFGLSTPTMGFAASTDLKESENPRETPSFEAIREQAREELRFYYRSPELVEVSKFKQFRKTANGATPKSDMYSLGIIFIPMLITFKSEYDRNDSLFDARNSNFNMDKNKNFQNLEKYRGQHEFAWIKKLVSPNISDRPLASEVQKWTKNVDGYVIDYGTPVSRSDLHLYVCMLDVYKEGELDDQNEIQTWYQRHVNTHLKLLLHEALISLPDKTDELIIRIRDYLDSDPDTISSNMTDLQYFNRKIGSVLADGSEDLGQLYSEFKLALSRDLRTSSGRVEAFAIMTRIQNTETFQKLEPLHDLKLQVIGYIMEFRCLESGEMGELAAGLTFDPEELEVRLEEVEELYGILTPCGPDCKGPLEQNTTNMLFCVRAKLLTKLGRFEAATELFQPIMSIITLELDELEGQVLSEFTPKILLQYCNFLVVCNRPQEALEKYRKLGKYYLKKADFEACENYLDHLLELYSTCGMEVNEVLEMCKNDYELIVPINVLRCRKNVIFEAKTLLLEAQEFHVPGDQLERTHYLDFDRLGQPPRDGNATN